ncbi:hypothetical protein [Bacillus sp. REN10]|nr:hypothetical protein [Bacillus sp. REN10]
MKHHRTKSLKIIAGKTKNRDRPCLSKDDHGFCNQTKDLID